MSLDSPRESLYALIKKNEPEALQQKTQEQKIFFNYLPYSFGKSSVLKNYQSIFQKFLETTPIEKQIDYIDIYFHEDAKEVRGRLKNRKIHFFGTLEMRQKEFLAV